jgi:hypothetical protein
MVNIGHVYLFSEEELTGLIGAGEIVDSNTLATYARLKARRLIG